MLSIAQAFFRLDEPWPVVKKVKACYLLPFASVQGKLHDIADNPTPSGATGARTHTHAHTLTLHLPAGYCYIRNHWQHVFYSIFMVVKRSGMLFLYIFHLSQNSPINSVSRTTINNHLLMKFLLGNTINYIIIWLSFPQKKSIKLFAYLLQSNSWPGTILSICMAINKLSITFLEI